MKIAIATLALVASASAWEVPEDAYTQFPIEHLPRDETGGIDHSRELWRSWEPPKAMTECFDYDKCKSCWMKECTDEADAAYDDCRDWDESKTDYVMNKDDKCGGKLDPSKPGDRGVCQNYGECVYEDCGYDCDNCKGPECDGDDSDDSDDSSSSSSSDDCKSERKECKQDCRKEHDRRLAAEVEMTDEQRRLGSSKLKKCYRSCKASFRDCKD